MFSNRFDPRAVMPYVVEESGRGERVFDIYSLLLRNRIIFLGTPINDQVANLIVAQLLYLSSEDPEAPIQMYINSPGGQVYAGLAIYDTMQMIPNKIRTFATSGNWSDTNCGSRGAPGNGQSGRNWMRDSSENCTNPP